LDTYLQNIVTDIQTLEEKSENYLPIVPYKEQIDTYLPTIPKTLNTYTSNSEITAYDNNAIFQYCKNGVKICLQDFLTQVLDIKSTGTVMLGSCSNNKGIVSVGGEMLNLYGKEKVSMYISSSALTTKFSFNDFGVQFEDNNNKLYMDKSISLLYGLNLSYKTTSISDPQNITEILKYYNKSLLITNASTEFDSEKEIIIPYGLGTSIGDNGIIFHKPGDEIINDTSPHQLKFPFGMRFEDDGNNLIIRQQGSSTKGVKIPWTTL
jgi:hypothetical protein